MRENRLIKIKLRRTMQQNRLVALLAISIEEEFANNNNIDDLIESF